MYQRRILIVDDEPGFIRLLKLVLEKTGRYVVREENDETRAVAVAKQFLPDLILLDLVMPSIDGGMVASRIRSESMN
jgi:CheY-like chemotaxis protein